MAFRHIQRYLLFVAIFQLLLLIAAWGFFAAVNIKSPLHLPDSSARWVYDNPTYTTTIVTIVATFINTLTLSCFKKAAGHALRQHITAQGSISLAHLSIGVALAKATTWAKAKLGETTYVRPALETAFIATIFSFVNSAWTTFLTPVQVHVLIPVNGQELDLSNPGFDTLLGQDINSTFGVSASDGLITTIPDSTYSFLSVGFTGGTTGAATYAFGEPGSFIFNDVAYNVSTGGILPATYGINQKIISTSAFGSAVAFGGGLVPTNLQVSPTVGISQTYEINQQGLTANVSCYNYTTSSSPVEVGTESATTTTDINGSVWATGNATLPSITCIPNGGTTFATGTLAAIVFDNPNYIETVVCPASWGDAANLDKMIIYHNGMGRYDALPPTICEVVPLVTQSTATYANQLVNLTAENATAIPNSHNLLFWLGILAIEEDATFQTITSNSLGDMLTSLVNAGPATLSEAPAQSYQLFLEFWKGSVEVLGTGLRSGYAAFPQSVTSSMLVPIVGTQDILTMGWTNSNRTKVYPLFMITLAGLITFATIAYALYNEHISEGGEARVDEAFAKEMGVDTPGGLVMPRTAMATFDASEPIHLVVASAGPRLTPGSHAGNYWDQYGQNVVTLQLDK